MIEQFESHVKELVKLAKKLYRYGLYLTIFFSIFFIIFLLLDLQTNYFGWVVFDFLMIILFLSEFLYGFYLHKKFTWILNNYRTEKDKCLQLLIVRKINFENLQMDLEKKDLSFAAKYYIHSKGAYDALRKEAIN